MLRCVRDVISNVARKMFTATPPSYITILELDRQVREFPMPVVPLPPDGPVDPWLSIQMYYTSYIRETREFDMKSSVSPYPILIT